jgi:hypothetical protein
MQTPLPYITRGAGQYGTGFGGVLRIFKRLVPHFRAAGGQLAGLAKSAGKSLLKTGAATSQKILGDVLAGKNIKEAAEERLQEAGTEIGEKVTKKLKKMRGSGRRRRRKSTLGPVRRRRRRTTAVRKRTGVKRRGGAVQGGSGRKRRRVQRRKKTGAVTKRRRRVTHHRRHDVFSV